MRPDLLKLDIRSMMWEKGDSSFNYRMQQESLDFSGSINVDRKRSAHAGCSCSPPVGFIGSTSRFSPLVISSLRLRTCAAS